MKSYIFTKGIRRKFVELGENFGVGENILHTFWVFAMEWSWTDPYTMEASVECVA